MEHMQSWPSGPVLLMFVLASLAIIVRSIVLLIGFLYAVRKMSQVNRVAVYRSFSTAMRTLGASDSVRSIGNFRNRGEPDKDEAA
jgi:hypothetical protein